MAIVEASHFFCRCSSPTLIRGANRYFIVALTKTFCACAFPVFVMEPVRMVFLDDR